MMTEPSVRWAFASMNSGASSGGGCPATPSATSEPGSSSGPKKGAGRTSGGVNFPSALPRTSKNVVRETENGADEPDARDWSVHREDVGQSLPAAGVLRGRPRSVRALPAALPPEISRSGRSSLPPGRIADLGPHTECSKLVVPPGHPLASRPAPQQFRSPAAPEFQCGRPGLRGQRRLLRRFLRRKHPDGRSVLLHGAAGLAVESEPAKIQRPEFGVEGYGPGQSFLHYEHFRYADDLDYVFFVYFRNDLNNIHQTGLFDLDDAGRLARNEAISPW